MNNFNNYLVLRDNEYQILLDIFGDILCCNDRSIDITYNQIVKVLSSPIVKACYKISVLNFDETVNYEIPLEDIVLDSVQLTENYTNGQRKQLSMRLINIDNKYTPDIDTLWYGTKIGFEQGFYYQNYPVYIKKGVYIIDDFDYTYNTTDNSVTYNLKDKYSMYDGATGTLLDAFEIPVGTPIKEALQSIQNLNCTDGNSYDLKPVILDSTLENFVTQQTIRIEAGSKIGELHSQLATQMSAEYYYNNVGYLCFYPINETLNDGDKPIIWKYKYEDIDGMQFKGTGEIVNTIKVISSNIAGSASYAIVKNENLGSNINVFYIKERAGEIIQDDNITSVEAAEERGKYELRKNTFIGFKQQINVPYNPLLSVNNLIEIEEDNLGIHGDRFLINSISHTANSGIMQIDVTNIRALLQDRVESKANPGMSQNLSSPFYLLNEILDIDTDVSYQITTGNIGWITTEVDIDGEINLLSYSFDKIEINTNGYVLFYDGGGPNFGWFANQNILNIVVQYLAQQGYVIDTSHLTKYNGYMIPIEESATEGRLYNVRNVYLRHDSGNYQEWDNIPGLTEWVKSHSKEVYEFNISNDVEIINGALSRCIELIYITIPNGAITIGPWAFYDCYNLTSITIPNSVTSIGSGAFYNCTGLTSVTIGNSVTGIGNYAFYGCTGLTSISIPNSVTSIGSDAFFDCTGLTSVTIGNGVKSIGDWTFYFCAGLTKVNYTGTIADWCKISFSTCFSNPLCYAGHLYISNEEVSNLVIPNSVTSIGNSAFFGCDGLTSVEIPNSVTSIGSSAFSNCTDLTSITIPNSVTSIGNGAFSRCTGLTSITIPNSVTSIGNSAFYNCTGLTSITIPNSVSNIGSYAFYDCTELASVMIGNGTTSINDGTFYGCTKLTNIISSNTTPPELGDYVFYEVPNDAAIYVPSSSVNTYKSATGWSDRADYIQSIPEE